MNWREPDDLDAQRLNQLFCAVVENRSDSIAALSEFEPLLTELYTSYDQTRVDRLGWMAFDLEERLEALDSDNSCAADVLHFCERLKELVGSPSAPGLTTNVGEMLVWLREIIGRATV